MVNPLPPLSPYSRPRIKDSISQRGTDFWDLFMEEIERERERRVARHAGAGAATHTFNMYSTR